MKISVLTETLKYPGILPILTPVQTHQQVKEIVKKVANSSAKSQNLALINPRYVMELSIALVLKMKTSIYARSHQNPNFQKLPPSLAMKLTEVVTILKS